MKSNEHVNAVALAQRILDTPYKDPDDNESMLAGQFLRQEERLVRLREVLTKDVLMELGSEQHEIMNPDHADEIRGILHDEPQFIRTGPFAN